MSQSRNVRHYYAAPTDAARFRPTPQNAPTFDAEGRVIFTHKSMWDAARNAYTDQPLTPDEIAAIAEHQVWDVRGRSNAEGPLLPTEHPTAQDVAWLRGVNASDQDAPDQDDAAWTRGANRWNKRTGDEALYKVPARELRR